jgi:hypothetical protein
MVAQRVEVPRPAVRGAVVRSPAFYIFLAVLALQGFHMLEHITQVVQRYALGIPNGSGILGSVVDVEPVHFVYNVGYLALLVTTCLLLGLHRDGPYRVGRAVFALLIFTLLFQGFHVIEHVVKMVQYVQLGFQNGTGGIFGAGPGGLAPLFAVPVLHLAYNAVAYLPAVLAFVLLMQRPSRPAWNPLLRYR